MRAVVFLLTYGLLIIPAWIFPMNRDVIDSLEKPSWSPPGMVIGFIWLVIYGLISLAMVVLSRNMGLRNLPLFWKVLATANYGFSILFFIGQAFSRNLLLSFLDTGLIAITAVLIAVTTWTYSPLAAGLLAPYALWTTFATYLSWVIYRLNSHISS
ncbi:TspO/MBR family protein [Heliophilum fasciatum]|uniref:TspO/MBR related protein n=1 Tax=Heliophilum fasciatum TaxID=35700 RepID=A0A4R2RQX9_9FIRM|nr:TspO/MBR family protein [Heliophilum fasciatum]MCW2277520.1 tryptophan-rich sensory protein [Heliophilum fasciatum]TCP65189.1 TspO/MBR related protein [Heliophilum fasciatum]